MLCTGDIIKWYESYGDICVIKDGGVGMILSKEKHHKIKIYKIYRIKHNDIMSFEETDIEKINKE